MTMIVRSDTDVESCGPSTVFLHLSGEMSTAEEWTDGVYMYSEMWATLPVAVVITSQDYDDAVARVRENGHPDVIVDADALSRLDPDTVVVDVNYGVSCVSDWVGDRVAYSGHVDLPATEVVTGEEFRRIKSLLQCDMEQGL